MADLTTLGRLFQSAGAAALTDCDYQACDVFLSTGLISSLTVMYRCESP